MNTRATTHRPSSILDAFGFLAVGLCLAACGDAEGDEDAQAPDADSGTADSGTVACPDSEAYCADDLWVCRPDIEDDYCTDEITLTVVDVDGSKTVETLEQADDPQVDCFYVYPTVDLTPAAGQVQNFDNLADILNPVRQHALPLSSVCRVFAPLYHQVQLGTYSQGGLVRDTLDLAYEDVDAAFSTYLDHYNAGRDFVLVGHSQGAHMLRRLIQRVEQDEALLERMVVALPIGSSGDGVDRSEHVTVPVGEVVGGSFESVPLCTTRAERGCFLTWDSEIAGSANGTAATDGLVTPCTNPASFDDSVQRLAGTYFLTQQYTAGLFGPFSPAEPTTFVVLRDAYTGQCVPDSTGEDLLEIAFAPGDGDVRTEPLALGTVNLIGSLHLLDFTYPLEDLLDVIQAKIDAK